MEGSLRFLGSGVDLKHPNLLPSTNATNSCSCTYSLAMVSPCTLYICCGQWLLLPDLCRNVVGYQTEGYLQCSRLMCFHIYQVIPKQKLQETKLFFLFFPHLSFLMRFLVFTPTPIISFLLWSLPLVRFYVFTYSILFFPVQWVSHINNSILIDGKWEPGQLFFFKKVINYTWLIWMHLKTQK